MERKLQPDRLMSMNRPVTTLLTLLALSSLAGCNKGEFAVVPVSGIITLDGQPLAEAHVGFEPMTVRKDKRAGPGSYGITDEAGRFELTTLKRENGAVVGKHRVTIRTFKANRGLDDGFVIKRQELLPDRYHLNSELTMEVASEGTDSANFELHSE